MELKEAVKITNKVYETGVTCRAMIEALTIRYPHLCKEAIKKLNGRDLNEDNL